MAFVIYNIETTKIYSPANFSNYFATERAAKAGRTRLINKNPELIGKLEITDSTTFHQHIEKQVYRTNMMSGKQYVEPINTPSYCSPSSESYWSS